MKRFSAFGRRGFIGAGLVAVGGALGWAVRALQRPSSRRASESGSLDSRFAYDVSEYETTDPQWLRYEPAERYETGLRQVKRLEAWPDGGWMVAGDRVVRFYDAEGRTRGETVLDRPPHCMAPVADGGLVVGLGNYFAVHDGEGKEILRSARLGENTFLTSLAVHGETVYLADAGSREVLMCHLRTGAVMDRFGKKDSTRNNPGFAVPSPYFDLALGRDGKLRVANPGRLRMETYTLDGRFESSWGAAGMGIDRFCGCCNPVFFTMRSDGGFITSEKGLTRVNLYDAKGNFEGAVAGPEVLVDDKELARRACADCQVGAGFDVALDGRGRVLVLDPFRKVVRTFRPKAMV